MCADPPAVPAAIPNLRDKLAQLLMVGVKNADDARAVVTDFHVGGIIIDSDTDLTMLPGPLSDIAHAATPLPLAVGVDEEGGRVSRLRTLLGGRGPTAKEMGADEPGVVVGDGPGLVPPWQPATSADAAARTASVRAKAIRTCCHGAFQRGVRGANPLPCPLPCPGLR
ncbi:hypothetical protein A5645_01345 [Mycobacterium asiaticum]|nr:hypothetical protein A5645_01345 [Mycobacterium asiaticum]